MIVSGRRARLGIGSACTLAAGLACLVSAASTPAAPRTSNTPAPVSPADAVATRAYLEAVYRLDGALLENAPASRAAETAFAQGLASECHGVLTGEPAEGLRSFSEAPKTPRARGELRRSKLQERTIEEELSLAERAAIYQPDVTAIEAFRAAVAQLTWSNAKIKPLSHPGPGVVGEHVATLLADVCPDMKAWAQSGYHVLSAATREFQAAETAKSEKAQAEIEDGEVDTQIGALLKPLENSADRRLVRHTKALETKLAAALSADNLAINGLRRALGESERPFEERRQEPVLGRRSTSAGDTVIVRAETGERPLGSSCKHPVSVEFERRRSGSSGLSSSSFGGPICLGLSSERHLSGSCGEDIETFTMAVAPSVRTVQLRLSDGETIASRVFRVPSKYGGPEGIYAEAVSVRNAHPVSLAELDARATVVKVLKPNFQCPVEGPKEAKVQSPKFVNLARGRTPTGKPFTIVGTLVHFGHKQTSFSLSLSSGLESLHNGSEEEGEISVSLGVRPPPPKAYPWSLGVECPPHEFAILYGILAPPGGSVMARTSAGLVALTKVPLAADLHAGGALVYGVFATLPSELVVRRGDGATLYTESLAARANEEREFCEGYAEA